MDPRCSEQQKPFESGLAPRTATDEFKQRNLQEQTLKLQDNIHTRHHLYSLGNLRCCVLHHTNTYSQKTDI